MIIGKIDNKEINLNNFNIKGIESESIGSLTKVAILTTLAGYLEKDNIRVNSNKFYSKKSLDKFLSFILNDKRAAPMDFNLNIEFENTKNISQTKSESNDFDCIVSFSGGVDSTAGLLYALKKGMKVLPVWIGFGQKNEESELKVIEKICEKLNLKLLIIKIDLKDYVDQGWNRWKLGIIPARNFLFAAIASELASKSIKKKVKIFICAHKEEITNVNTDKSKRFYRNCNKIFEKLYDKEIELTTPFFEITKPEIIYYWVKNWKKEFDISPHDTISCYLGNNCGTCKACFNRALSFTLVGEEIGNHLTNPFKDEQEIIQKGYISRFAKLQLDRKIDIIYALYKNYELLPKNLKDFVNSNYKKYEKRINTRLEEIKKVKIN